MTLLRDICGATCRWAARSHLTCPTKVMHGPQDSKHNSSPAQLRAEAYQCSRECMWFVFTLLTAGSRSTYVALDFVLWGLQLHSFQSTKSEMKVLRS